MDQVVSLKRCSKFWAALVQLFCLATFAPINAQQQSDLLFTGTEALIPMRDGVRLHTQVYTPTHATERLPILLLRTPYGIGDVSSAQLVAAIPELAADGYIFVRQDIRGRFKSEGQFVMLRQPRDPKDKRAIDESTDTYDTTQWLLANVSNHNGRAGMAGTSYGAWLTVMGMLTSNTSIRDLRNSDNVASPHAEIGQEVKVVPWRSLDNIAPAGSINSNVVDVAQWLRLQLGQGALENQRLISSGAFKEMQTSQTMMGAEFPFSLWHPEIHLVNYGLGWILSGAS